MTTLPVSDVSKAPWMRDHINYGFSFLSINIDKKKKPRKTIFAHQLSVSRFYLFSPIVSAQGSLKTEEKYKGPFIRQAKNGTNPWNI